MTASYYGKAGLSLSGKISPNLTRYDLGTNVQVKYVVTTGQIQLIKPDGKIISFLPSELDVANSSDGIAIYQRGSSGIDGIPKEVFELHAPKINGVTLSYTRFGTYAKVNVSLSPSIEPLAAFVFGQPTASGSMPVSGNASYTSDLFGVVVKETGSVPPDFYTMGDGYGSATFSANFGSGTVSTLINLDTDGGGNFGTLNGSGTITSGGPAFNGTLTGSANGGFTGAFFGPNAVEMGYVFQAQGTGFVTYGNVFGTKAPPP
ncbi:MAG TPA: transferrin-binding protein-like solute binding protein [Sphingomonadaceae bacterium]|nr:transferrin-binding protein-like solute binding protein [Sphingomonadaceae bacterium]